jgi:hypothetical protein
MATTEVQEICATSYVGFDSIAQQIELKQLRHGFQFNVIKNWYVLSSPTKPIAASLTCQAAPVTVVFISSFICSSTILL